MPNTTLGLDLGSNSIGWALLDEDEGRIVAAGVRVFPEGVDRDTKGGELSKNETRRVARGMRRQIARRARRKKKLREALVLSGLLPGDPAAQATLDALNPYELRSRALHERLEPFEIGRILVHLNQRRGFLSNRKADKGKKKEDSETLAEISQLAADIEAAGHATLGEHLAAKYAAAPLERLRGKHTRRDMYEQEFHKLWDAQRAFHPQLLTDALKFGARGPQSYPRKPEQIGKNVAAALGEVGLYGLIFFQRPMYWPKWVVGQCELDPKQKRCPKADRVAQRIRVVQEVNNLKLICGGEILTPTAEQRKTVLALLAAKKEVKFDELRKKLKLHEQDGFNLEFGGRTKLLGMETDAALAAPKVFGKGWHDLPEDRKNAIVRSLIHDEEAVFLERAGTEWGLARDVAEKLLEVNLPEGYASYGRTTIEKLLPHLERGLPLTARGDVPCAVRMAGFLPPWERPIKGGQYLPPPPEITNPIVRQGLFEVRKLINAILREYGKPRAIHIELAREVKGNAEQRARQSQAMRDRERRRAEIAERLENEYGEKPTRSKIERYLLWEEQGGVCIYSGREIGVRQLLGGEVDIDHILPYSKSLDDSLMNKVVCFRDENEAKGQQTVYEWLAATQPEKYDHVLQRASQLPYEIRNRKRPLFGVKTCELTDFIERQLRDTAYLTSAVVDYVRCLGVDVLGGKGQLTAELRRRWGLNNVLRDDGLNLKNREDHRHHAVDAVVIALTNRSRLQQLARGDDEMPPPWDGFREAVETAINAINVSHRVRRKVAGALHEETVYGATQKPGEFVYRKPLTALTPAMIDDIRDGAIRELVRERLREHGIDAEVKKIPGEVWKEPLRMKSGVVVKKVRLLRRDLTMKQLGSTQGFVKPGSNHHVCFFRMRDANGKEIRVAEWVTMLEAVARVNRHEPLVRRVHPQHPDARFWFSLSRGELVLAEFKGEQRLVCYKTGASTQGQLYFVLHADARPTKDIKLFVATANTLKARKVSVDLLGRIRWAND